MHRRNDFWMRERECERLFEATGPYYFITTQNLGWLLYKSREEFITGTNLLAVSASEAGFEIVDEIQMNNHHHVIGAGSLQKARAFCSSFKDKMRRYQLSLGNKSLKDWEIRVDLTSDVKQFRNRVAYTDRNAYVVRLDSTPFGYPWGSANLFFNGNMWLSNPGTAWNDLTIDTRRSICRSHDIDLPEAYRVVDGMITRQSFVNYRLTESLFNSANQYFTMLSRHGEADIELSKMLGEGIQLPNEEVFQIVGSWHSGSSLRDLAMEERLGSAKRMKTQLGSSNKQISQILQLDLQAVERMFPSAR